MDLGDANEVWGGLQGDSGGMLWGGGLGEGLGGMLSVGGALRDPGGRFGGDLRGLLWN